MLSNNKDISRIIMFGNSGTGKTSLCRAINDEKFSSRYKASIGHDFFSLKRYNVPPDGADLQCVQLWDTAFNHRFTNCFSPESYLYRFCNVVLLVYDASEYKSFGDLEDIWLGEIRQGFETYRLPISADDNSADMNPKSKLPFGVTVFLVGTKCDLIVETNNASTATTTSTKSSSEGAKESDSLLTSSRVESNKKEAEEWVRNNRTTTTKPVSQSVSDSEARRFSEANGFAGSFRVSSKTDDGINELLDSMFIAANYQLKGWDFPGQHGGLSGDPRRNSGRYRYLQGGLRLPDFTKETIGPRSKADKAKAKQQLREEARQRQGCPKVCVAM